MTSTFEEAESACKQAYFIAVVDSVNCHLLDAINTSGEADQQICGNTFKLGTVAQIEKMDLQKQLRELKAAKNKLKARKGEFARAQRIAKDADGVQS